MIQASSIVLFVVSLTLIVIALLFFVTIGGVVSAHIKSFLGDDSALEQGFGSFNPLVHIDEIWIMVFLIIHIFIAKQQPPFTKWYDGIKGFFQKISYLFLPSLFHLIVGSIMACIIVKWLGVSILNIACITPLSPSSKFIGGILEIYSNLKGLKMICLLLFLYGIGVNIMLAILNFFFAIINYFLQIYIEPYMQNMLINISSFIVLALILMHFSGLFFQICWMIISLPIIFII